MEEVNKFIYSDEVISIDDKDDNVLIAHHTYKAEEFLNRLGEHIDRHKKEKWIDEGVPCKLLSPNQNWQRGKMKICLQFIPEQPESVLDDQGFALEGRRQKAEGRRIKPTSSFYLQDTSPVVYDGKAFGGGASLFQTSNLLPSALVAQRLLPSFDAEILEPKSGEWKKGKMRMRVILEFCPDEPEVMNDRTQQNGNSLDDIRQTIS